MCCVSLYILTFNVCYLQQHTVLDPLRRCYWGCKMLACTSGEQHKSPSRWANWETPWREGTCTSTVKTRIWVDRSWGEEKHIMNSPWKVFLTQQPRATEPKSSLHWQVCLSLQNDPNPTPGGNGGVADQRRGRLSRGRPREGLPWAHLDSTVKGEGLPGHREARKGRHRHSTSLTEEAVKSLSRAQKIPNKRWHTAVCLLNLVLTFKITEKDPGGGSLPRLSLLWRENYGFLALWTSHGSVQRAGWHTSHPVWKESALRHDQGSVFFRRKCPLFLGNGLPSLGHVLGRVEARRPTIFGSQQIRTSSLV